jgi:hypothetical protein
MVGQGVLRECRVHVPTQPKRRQSVQPMHGVVSKTPLYRVIYRFTGPLPERILETTDINKAAKA